MLTKLKKHRYKLYIIGYITLILGSGIFITHPQHAKLCCNKFARIITAPNEIKGSVITLKKLQDDYFIDYHNMFSHIVRDAFEAPKHIGLDYTIRSLRRIMQQSAEGNTLFYCIFNNTDKRLVGGVEIRAYNEFDNGQLGIWLNEQYWGGGRVQEALRLISDAYFAQNPKLASYIAHVRPWNKRSYKALLKFGFIDLGYKEATNRHILEYHKPHKN